MTAWRDIWGEELDRASVETVRTAPVRILTGALIFPVMALTLGPAVTAVWVLVQLCLEAWTTLAARLAARRPGALARTVYFTGASLKVFAWASLSGLYWRTGEPGLQLAAAILAFGQVIHGLVFQAQFRAIQAVTAGAPLVLLTTLLIGDPAFRGLELVTVFTAILLVSGYSLTGARQNWSALQRLKDAERRAIEASAAKSAALATISHELRTPMNGVLGMAHALRGTRLDREQAAQVEMLIESGDSLLVLLNDILDFSKIEAGRVELERTAFDVAALGRQVCELWREAAAAKGLELIYDLAPDAPAWIEADPTRLRQVLVNLVSNAIKFTDAGHVRLALRGLSDPRPGWTRFEVTVSDTGIGMTPEQRAGIFQAFAQAEASTTRIYGGTGLGLSICDRLTRLMGAQIEVDSEPGIGSIFTFALEAPLAAAPHAEPEPAALDGLGGLRVLVADDNRVNQLVACAVLDAAGALHGVANDGAEALERLREGLYDLVLMDVRMPILDGIDALRRIRAGETGDPATPVIALTADAAPDEAARLRALGFDDVQSKPVQPLALISAIAAAYARSRAPVRRAAAST